LQKYWATGGFPEVIEATPALRLKVHQEYFHTILFRDVVERHNINQPRALLDLAHRLMENIASLHSVNSLTGYLKSLSHKVPKSSVGDYLEWLEDAYFLYAVRLFDPSLSRSQYNPKKIYCVDHALVTSVSSSLLVNAGHLLENLVFVTLRRQHREIYYYRTRSGKEVDFILPHPQRPQLIQVCETLVEAKTRKRELAALAEAMSEMQLTSSTLVTRSEEERIELPQGLVEVVPCWQFLLDFPSRSREG